MPMPSTNDPTNMFHFIESRLLNDGTCQLACLPRLLQRLRTANGYVRWQHPIAMIDAPSTGPSGVPNYRWDVGVGSGRYPRQARNSPEPVEPLLDSIHSDPVFFV